MMHFLQGGEGIKQTPIRDPEDPISPEEILRIRAEQVRLLYKNAAVSMVASLVNSLVLVVILWHVSDHVLLIGWTVGIFIVTAFRYLDVLRFRRASNHPLSAVNAEKHFVAGTALSGIAWGSSGFLIFPETSVAHQAFHAFVLGGMVIGSAGAYAVLRRAFFAFSIPAAAPLFVSLVITGDAMHLAMGGMVLLFMVLITAVALHINTMTTTSVKVRFANMDLLSYLASAKEDAENLARDLSVEVDIRRKTEEELMKHREHLTELVHERTAEMVAANEQLRKEILERVSAEEALKRSEEKYRLLFENMLDGCAHCRMLFEDNRPQDFIYLDVNSAFENLTGLKNVVGSKASEVIPATKDTYPELFEAYGRVALTGKPERHEVYFEPPGAWLSISVYSTKTEFFIAVFTDITERKKTEELLQHQAYHDNLTALPNRALFIDHTNVELTHARRCQTKVVVLFLDLDRFKSINDSLGHSVGDELLRQVAGRLKATVRESDTVARIGGDEFAVLLTDIVRVEDIATVAGKIMLAFIEPFAVYDENLHVTASMGISFYPDGGQHAEDLMKNADSAMYQAKKQGRNNYQFYVP